MNDMNDMSGVIVPKSDQLNADSLMGGPMTITIKGVGINAGQEQPVAIDFGDPERVYRPCKSMSRVLVAAWGPDAKQYTGRSLTLYRDPTVKWGGLEVGGIRISHMSHIAKEMTLALTATRAQRKPYTVKPLGDAPKTAPKPTTGAIDKWAADARARFEAAQTPHDLAGVTAWWNSPDNLKARERAHGANPDLAAAVKAEFQAAVARLSQMDGEGAA